MVHSLEKNRNIFEKMLINVIWMLVQKRNCYEIPDVPHYDTISNVFFRRYAIGMQHQDQDRTNENRTNVMPLSWIINMNAYDIMLQVLATSSYM